MKTLLALILGSAWACPPCPVCTSTSSPTTTSTTTTVGIKTTSTVSAPAVKPQRDLWEWQSEVATPGAAQTAFFTFAAKHNIRYIHIECEGLIQLASQATLATFLTDAQSHGIGVYCLFANSTWALTANHQSAVDLANLAGIFRNAHPLLLGVDYDVEPDWGTDQKSVEAQYISMVGKIKTALGTWPSYSQVPPAPGFTPTPLMMTIPYFWSGSGYDLTISGVTKHLDEWVLDYADINIMDFYNTTSRIVSGMDEINHAAAKHRKALVGLLMEQDLDLTYTSFYSFFFPDPLKGEAYLDKTMADSAATFMANSSQALAFNGFIIEDYKWYLQAAQGQ